MFSFRVFSNLLIYQLFLQRQCNRTDAAAQFQHLSSETDHGMLVLLVCHGIQTQPRKDHHSQQTAATCQMQSTADFSGTHGPIKKFHLCAEVRCTDQQHLFLVATTSKNVLRQRRCPEFAAIAVAAGAKWFSKCFSERKARSSSQMSPVRIRKR